ncbi:type II secretion system F family protein [Streptomyces sp. CC219B]|uniref:type II secretion system F family protein n=1 Tax=Streptomyces sp. CC219B TaxID=3044574 RepID=UPI0024A92212|nr:type II secretion system F family protein [Streptomyces sp. CC219B]
MSTEVVHRLGVAVGVLVAVGWLVGWGESVRRERRVRHRAAELLAAEEARPARARFQARGVARRWLPAVAVACAGWLLVGGVVGAVVGVTAAAAMDRWLGRRTAAGSGTECDPAEVARQLPLAADLLAACIAAGAGPVDAAEAVGEALGGPVGEGLARGAAEMRLGSEPGAAWQTLAAMPGAGPLAGLLERADVSGLPAAGPVARLAEDARADWARAATARARRAAVLVTAPVGLCFLPAFIAVGVLPVVIGLADGVLGGGGP